MGKNIEIEMIYPALTWDDVVNKPTTFIPSEHTQDISTINGLQDELDTFAIQEDTYTKEEVDVLISEISTINIEIDSDGLKGQPVYIKNNGHIDLGKADEYLTSKIIGLLNEDVLATFSVNYINNSTLTLTDWTEIIDSQHLSIGSYYYLSKSKGKLTNIAPNIGYVVKIGQAISENILQIEIEQPIRL